MVLNLKSILTPGADDGRGVQRNVRDGEAAECDIRQLGQHGSAHIHVLERVCADAALRVVPRARPGFLFGSECHCRPARAPHPAGVQQNCRRVRQKLLCECTDNESAVLLPLSAMHDGKDCTT